MKFFNKKEQTENTATNKLRNKAAFKHGGYSIAITAVVVAIAVLANLFFGFLSERVNLDIDISLSGSNTLSEENIEFIKNIDKDVKIIVCSTESDYTNGNLNYIAQNYYNASDASGTYYKQTLNLLDLYSVYSDKITVEFADPYDPSFTAISTEYASAKVAMGDIIVEAYQNVDSKDVKRSSVISFDDIYYLTDDSGYAAMGYGSYTVSGSNLETALTSAIYKVTSAETKQALVLSTHCAPNSMESLVSLLELNNFEVDTQEGNVISEISNDYEIVIISGPSEDFMIEELELIDEWLYNSGDRGKGVMYFASPTSPDMPNLEEYLTEWGVGFDDGVLFETDKNNYLSGDPMTIGFEADSDETENDVVDDLKKSTAFMISGGNVPMYQLFEEENLRTTYQIVSTPKETVVKAPLGTSNDWSPDSSYEKSKYSGIILSCEADYKDNILCTSYVAAFSSYDFAGESWLTSYDINSEPMLSVAKVLSDTADDGISFTMKTQKTESFSDVVTENSSKIISIIFQITLPILLIAFGIFVFVRRSRR